MHSNSKPPDVCWLECRAQSIPERRRHQSAKQRAPSLPRSWMGPRIEIRLVAQTVFYPFACGPPPRVRPTRSANNRACNLESANEQTSGCKYWAAKMFFVSALLVCPSKALSSSKFRHSIRPRGMFCGCSLSLSHCVLSLFLWS